MRMVKCHCYITCLNRFVLKFPNEGYTIPIITQMGGKSWDEILKIMNNQGGEVDSFNWLNRCKFVLVIV